MKKTHTTLVATFAIVQFSAAQNIPITNRSPILTCYNTSSRTDLKWRDFQTSGNTNASIA